MKDVIDIILKDGRAFVIMRRHEREVFDRIKDDIRKMHDDIRKIELMDPFMLFENPDMLKEVFEGFSLFSNRNFSENMGLKKYTRYQYSLEKLNNSQKAMFSYDLVGRRGQKGLLKRFHGNYLGKGVIDIPTEHEKMFNKFLKECDVTFSKSRFFRW